MTDHRSRRQIAKNNGLQQEELLQAFFDEKVDNDAYLFGRFIIICRNKKGAYRVGSFLAGAFNPSTLHFCRVRNNYIFFSLYRQGKIGAEKGKILFALEEMPENRRHPYVSS